MPFNLNKEIDKANFILDIIGARQEALSTNLANINTPGYVRKDISFEKYLGSYNKALETDLSRRMGSVTLPKQGEEGINMTEELAAMQRNALFYTIASRRTAKLIEEIKTVSQIGR